MQLGDGLQTFDYKVFRQFFVIAKLDKIRDGLAQSQDVAFHLLPLGFYLEVADDEAT